MIISNNNIKKINLTDEQVKNIQEIYFKKVAMENLIENLGGADKTPDSTLSKYGEICAKFSDTGMAIIEKNFPEIKPKKWDCNFETKEFTIEY